MNFSIKKISILLLLVINFIFLGCGDKENCFFCNGHGELSCAICEKNELKQEGCQFCNGTGQSICSLCDGTGIEKINRKK